MKAFRTALFWGHLVAGLAAGILIFTMSVTGVLLAFQPQVLDWLERDQRSVALPDEKPTRLPPSQIIGAAMEGRSGPGPATLTISADPAASATVSFGRDGLRYVDPYRGVVLGEGAAAARAAFQWLIEFHRWLAASPDYRPAVRMATGGSSLLFAGLALSGLVLWWPRRLSAEALLRAATPRWPAAVAARHFNWHTVIGFWCAPVLVVLALSGVVLSFPWANRALHVLAGTPLPPAAPRAAAPEPDRPRRAGAASEVSVSDYRALDPLWLTAEQQMPTWGTIAVRIPARMQGPASFTITDAAHWNRFGRSQLTMDPATGAVVRWEPYSDITRGQRWRGWARFAHTGELGGLAGQVIAGAASAGAVVLVWSGFSLALRRFARARSRKQQFARAA